MLPQHERLRHQQDFDQLRKHGKTYHQPQLRLVVLKEDSDRRLAGFIVSKRISKKAVERNQLKRRLRAAYLALQPRLESGYLLLFIARPESSEAKYQDLQSVMSNLLQRARVLRPC